MLCGGIVNGLFRFVWGITLQKIGFKWLFVLAMIINIACFGFAPLAIHFYYAYLLIYMLSCCVIGGLMVVLPNLCLMVFGDRVGNQIYGYVWMFFTLSNFLQYFISLQFTTKFVYMMWFFMFTSSLALILASITRFQGPWLNSLNKLTF